MATRAESGGRHFLGTSASGESDRFCSNSAVNGADHTFQYGTKTVHGKLERRCLGEVPYPPQFLTPARGNATERMLSG